MTGGDCAGPTRCECDGGTASAPTVTVQTSSPITTARVPLAGAAVLLLLEAWQRTTGSARVGGARSSGANVWALQVVAAVRARFCPVAHPRGAVLLTAHWGATQVRASMVVAEAEGGGRGAGGASAAAPLGRLACSEGWIGRRSRHSYRLRGEQANWECLEDPTALRLVPFYRPWVSLRHLQRLQLLSHHPPRCWDHSAYRRPWLKAH